MALAIFGVSRLIMLMGFVFSVTYVKPSTAPGLWNISTAWWRYLLRFDSAYYLDIARQGYAYNGNPLQMQNIVFFPGYPLMVRLAAWVLPVSLPFSAIFVSNLCAVGAIVLLYGLISRLWGRDVALVTVALVSFFPTSLFLSAAYSEAIALLFTTAALTFLFRGRLALASVCAGCLSATRPIGFVLAVPLAYEVWLRTGRRFSWRFLGYAGAAAVTAASGLIAFGFYCWIRFHDPLAFLHAQAAWREAGGTGGLAAWRHLKGGLRDPGLLYQPNFNDGWFFLAFLVITIAAWRRFPAALNLYTAAILVALIVTRVFAEPGFISMNRYLLLVFPCMTGVALLAGRRLALLICAPLAALLLIYSALFAQWQWAG